MGGSNKLGLAKQAVLEAIHRLDAEDRFSVVTYDDQIDVAIASTTASPEARRRAADDLRHVDARGSTNLHGGWLTGCEQVAAGIAGRRREPRPAAHRRPRQRRGRRPRRAPAASASSCASAGSRPAPSAWAPTSTSACSRAWRTPVAATSTSSATWPRCGTTSRARWGRRSRSSPARSSSSSPFPTPSASRRSRRSGSRVDRAASACPGGRHGVGPGALDRAPRLTFDYGDVGREVGVSVRVADRDGAFVAAQPAAGARHRHVALRRPRRERRPAPGP